MIKRYAGIGSRETPRPILDLMTLCSIKLDSLGYVLRSGHAVGADSAFEYGSNHKEIFVANDATSNAIEMASNYHNNWENCSVYVKKLHGRNSMIILGEKLDTPVQFVLCWTKDGRDSGGTGLAIRLARHLNIPVFNLYNYEDKLRIYKFLNINTELPDIF